MKRFNIVHKTVYEYSEVVYLSTHALRLRPREGHDQHIESSHLLITPQANIRWLRDIESNSVALATFLEPTSCLTIESHLVVRKYDISPYDFLIEEYAVMHPFSYPVEDKVTLTAYLLCEDNNDIKNWVNAISRENKSFQSFDLLLLLNKSIYESMCYIKRNEEGVQSSQVTLSTKMGSCRDFASLFIDAARYLGFAARFVSGYVYTESAASFTGTTHAWSEVFIPGAGWKGFDPTHGSLVGAHHIAVAVSRLPELIPAISGAFWGSLGSKLKVDVWVTEIE